MHAETFNMYHVPALLRLHSCAMREPGSFLVVKYTGVVLAKVRKYPARCTVTNLGKRNHVTCAGRNYCHFQSFVASRFAYFASALG